MNFNVKRYGEKGPISSSRMPGLMIQDPVILNTVSQALRRNARQALCPESPKRKEKG